MAGPSPSRPILRDRFDQKRHLVVSAAARVFADRGFHGTTIKDVAAETGLAVGGVYHYVGSKEELLVAVCNDLLDPLLYACDEVLAAHQDPEDRLRRVVAVWVRHVATHTANMVVFDQERHVIAKGRQWSEIRRRRKAFEELLDRLLADGEAAGAFAFADRDLARLALLGMVNHTAQWFRPRGRLSPEEVADGFCDLLLGRSVAPSSSA